MDEQAWLQGLYICRSVHFAIDHAFSGNKATVEYYEKPLLQSKDSGKKEQTEEETIQAHENFFTYLGAMQANFELEHPEKKHRSTTTESEVVTHG